jgi:hypothetical protein
VPAQPRAPEREQERRGQREAQEGHAAGAQVVEQRDRERGADLERRRREQEHADRQRPAAADGVARHDGSGQPLSRPPSP